MSNVKRDLDQVNYRLTKMTNRLQQTAFERQDHALETAVDLIRTLQHELVFVLDPENEWNPENMVNGSPVIQWDMHSICEVEEALMIAEYREREPLLQKPVSNGNIPQFK